ncbi:MAG: glycosyltransferase family 1 protein [Cellulomonadaceae bacterium]
MRVAVKHNDVRVDALGRVCGHDAGATLVRRILRTFGDAELIGPGPRRCEGFDMVPLEFVDGRERVVISMDVIDSVDVWRTMSRTCRDPQVMNFLWWSTSRYASRVELASLALSCALFPTFANSERTAHEVREIVQRWEIAPLVDRTRVAWVNLGFRHEHVQPRRRTSLPIVLYPAIYLSERKRPAMFLDIATRARQRVPLQVEMRLTDTDLAGAMAASLRSADGVSVGPLIADRDGYWDALARTTAFLATAAEESYGMAYVEALAAGAVGIFPELEWAHALLPDGYPFVYANPAEAEDLLVRAVREPATCLREMDHAAGGDFQKWLRERHDDDLFERAIVRAVTEWFS